MTEPLDLAPIEARATAATRGPWDRDPQHGPTFFAYTGGPYLEGVGDFNFGVGEQADADEDFVRHAQPDVTALIDEVKRLRAAAPSVPADAERREQVAQALVRHDQGIGLSTPRATPGEHHYREADAVLAALPAAADRATIYRELADLQERTATTDVIRRRRSIATGRRLFAVELRRMADEAQQAEPIVTVHTAPDLSTAAEEALGALVDVAKAQMTVEAEHTPEPS